MELFDIVLKNAHTMIAGSTGSGKSVFLNSLYKYTTANYSPDIAKFIFIDSKGTEFYQYRNAKNVYLYSGMDTPVRIATNLLKKILKYRLFIMRLHNEQESRLTHLYFVIDEFVDIRLHHAAAIQEIAYLSSISRAAHIHIVLATQRPTKDVIPGLLAANFPVKIGLRTNSKQESRNAIGFAGCEDLPLFGECLVMDPGRKSPERFTIPKL